MCKNCGRKVNISEGSVQSNLTLGGWKYPQPVFLCNRCIKYERFMKKEKLKQLNAIAEYSKSLPSYITREHKAMIEVLKDLVKVSGWYRLADITKSFTKKMGCDYHVRTVSGILNRLGFTERKQMGQGYTRVWVDLAILKDRDEGW